jgi:hypothetical protein
VIGENLGDHDSNVNSEAASNIFKPSNIRNDLKVAPKTRAIGSSPSFACVRFRV